MFFVDLQPAVRSQPWAPQTTKFMRPPRRNTTDFRKDMQKDAGRDQTVVCRLLPAGLMLVVRHDDQHRGYWSHRRSTSQTFS